MSKLLTSCPTAVKKHWIRYYDTVYERDGINYFWSIKNSNDVLNKFKSKNFQASLRKLDDEANKFYDRKHDLYEAALLTRCYTQHALRPYTDSEINHIRHFIKIPFINKCIEFIDLPSIFRDNNVISAIPSYFENTESPIIYYK